MSGSDTKVGTDSSASRPTAQPTNSKMHNYAADGAVDSAAL